MASRYCCLWRTRSLDSAAISALCALGSNTAASPPKPMSHLSTSSGSATWSVKMKRLSCHRFRSNEVRLWPSVIAYNLGNLWRRLVLPRRIDNWSLTSLQQRLVKTGGRLVRHA